jgi:TIGR03009 family protein
MSTRIKEDQMSAIRNLAVLLLAALCTLPTGSAVWSQSLEPNSAASQTDSSLWQSASQSTGSQQEAAGNQPVKTPGDPQTTQLQLPQATPPQHPAWDPLPPNEANYLNSLLDYWEQSSQQIKLCKCDFICWEYDPTFCIYRDPGDNKLAAYIVKTGELRFQAPDKARYDTHEVWDFKQPPQQPGQQPIYEQREQTDQNRERWICDGQTIYEFNFAQKRLYETQIPPEMQGNGLVNSPLPFVFGAKKEVILDRFWVRVLPRNIENEYWLEALPKRIDDARNYQKLEIIIAREDFLPKSIHIYAPNFDAKLNPISRHFEFKNRYINDQLSKIQDFLGLFVRPNTPLGWERVDRQALTDPQQMRPASLSEQGQINR